MNKERLTSILVQIDLPGRYTDICKKYFDFDNAMRKTKISELKQVVLKLPKYEFRYSAKDKMFLWEGSLGDDTLRIGMKIHNGFCEVFIFFIQENDWIIYNRLDFLSEAIDENFDRTKYSLPSYRDFNELQSILNSVLDVINDFIGECRIQYKI